MDLECVEFTEKWIVFVILLTGLLVKIQAAFHCYHILQLDLD